MCTGTVHGACAGSHRMQGSKHVDPPADSPTFGECSDDVKVLRLTLKQRALAEEDRSAAGGEHVVRCVLRFGLAKGVDGCIKVRAVHAPQCALVKHAAVAALPVILAASWTGNVSGMAHGNPHAVAYCMYWRIDCYADLCTITQCVCRSSRGSNEQLWHKMRVYHDLSARATLSQVTVSSMNIGSM